MPNANTGAGERRLLGAWPTAGSIADPPPDLQCLLTISGKLVYKGGAPL